MPEDKHVILEDFLLEREASLCSSATLDWYSRMLKPFISHFNLTARDIRRFLAGRAGQISPASLHAHARAIRALVNFAHREGYLEEPIKVTMPKVPQKRMEVLTVDEIGCVLKHANVLERALVMLLIDSGLRRGEALALTWDDIDFRTGAVIVRHGKGGKERLSVVGAKTRRALLKLRRTSTGERVFNLTGSGCASMFARLTKKSGVKINAHKCRRTFATLALRGGMDVITLQALMGHNHLSTTERYVRLVDADLVNAHRAVGILDKLIGGAR